MYKSFKNNSCRCEANRGATVRTVIAHSQYNSSIFDDDQNWLDVQLIWLIDLI